MPEAKTLNERDTKLVSWLAEAHAKEAELEADLNAHIALTGQAYKKRLQQHLKETREHKRRVAARIKKLGGPGGQGLLAVPATVGEVAGKTVAAVKGQVGVARALVTATRRICATLRRTARGAHRDRDLHPHRGARHRGGGPRDGAARPRDPPRRGTDGQVPRHRAQPARQGRRPRRDPARPASDGDADAVEAVIEHLSRPLDQPITIDPPAEHRIDSKRALPRHRAKLTATDAGGPAGLESGRAAPARRVRSDT